MLAPACRQMLWGSSHFPLQIPRHAGPPFHGKSARLVRDRTTRLFVLFGLFRGGRRWRKRICPCARSKRARSRWMTGRHTEHGRLIIQTLSIRRLQIEDCRLFYPLK